MNIRHEVWDRCPSPLKTAAYDIDKWACLLH